MPRYTHKQALITVLIAAREAAGLTRRQLSDKLGKRHNFVSQTELGERKLGADELPEYGAGLGLSAVELIVRMEAERALHVTAEATAAIQRLHARARKKASKPRKKS